MKEKEPRRSQTDNNPSKKTQSVKKSEHISAPAAAPEYRYIIPGLLLAVAPFLVTYILEIIAYFADFAIVTALNTYLGFSIEFDEGSYIGGNMPTNTTVTNLIYAILCLIIFGWWYLMVCEQKRMDSTTADKADTEKTDNNLLKIIALLAAGGIAFQLFVDSILSLVRRIAPKLFTSYDEMIDSMTERTFWLMLTVIILGPIAEELIFRGLTLHFARKVLPIRISVLLSSLLFGIYHGSIIQGIYAFAAGIILCQIAIKFESLLPAVFLHIMINTGAYLIPDDLLSAVIPSVLILIMSGAIIYLTLMKLVVKHDKKTSL